MKKIVKTLSLLAGAALLLSSCGEDLEILQEHPKQADAQSFMTNYKSVEAEVNAIYYQMHRLQAYGRYLIVLTEGLSDYCYGRGNYATSYETGLTSGAVGFVKDTWAIMYRCIRFSNDLMRQIDNVGLSDADYKALTGEIRFLRALAYSQLLKYWGAVPFFTEDNMDDFNKPRTDEAIIWQWIEDECAYAYDALPKAASIAGRPSKGAAAMLKGQAALYLKHYAVAQEAFESIIDSKQYSLVEVTTADDFAKLYGVDVVSTTEEIFYIKYNRDVAGEFFWMYLCSPNPVRNTGSLGIYTDQVKNKVIANWDPADLLYQWDLYRQTANGTLNALTDNGIICFKFRDTEATGSTSANDNPVFRYADALLYAAEARAMALGAPDATALKYVNNVRRRAYGLKPNVPSAKDYALSDYADNDKFIDLILKERAYEQCFEGKRYADLKRLGKLAEYAVKAGRVASESDVRDAAYWWPIPTDEYNYTDALDPTVDQNPGY